MEIATPRVDVLGKFLDLTAQQFKLTSSNIANLDTPNYHALGIDFASEFSAAASQTLGARLPVATAVFKPTRPMTWSQRTACRSWAMPPPMAW